MGVRDLVPRPLITGLAVTCTWCCPGTDGVPAPHPGSHWARRVPRAGRPGPQRRPAPRSALPEPPSHAGPPTETPPWDPNQPQSRWGRAGRWVQGRGPGGAAGEPARQRGAAPTPASPALPPAPITKRPLLAPFPFNHVSPLSIKAISKVNYLLPSAARPTPLHQHQPQHHVAK